MCSDACVRRLRSCQKPLRRKVGSAASRPQRNGSEEDHLDFLMQFPAVLEGAPRPKRELPPEFAKALKDAADLINNKPSTDNLLRITAIVHGLGVPEGIGPALLQIDQSLRREAGTMDKHVLNAVVTLLAHIAVLAKDAALAEAT